jgi:Mg-chelatase subunit ChlD
MNSSLTYLERAASGPAALRLSPPQREGRTASHFIALADISDSMADGHKLTNVKECLKLLLKFLAPEDEFSLVVFGETSRIVQKRVKAEPSSIGSIERSIEQLCTDGCTNLSAGLASVREILEEATAAGSTLKPGLLVLTDGHANRGEASASGLSAIINRIHELYANLSFSFVAYGTDHNSGLLKSLAEGVIGSYSIVEDIEGAALTMGEALGGLISCVAQNVTVTCPPGTTVSGPYKVSAEGVIALGDLYAGSQTLLLLDLPEGEVAVRGCALPTLDPFREVPATQLDTGRNVEIDLTRLRYRCAELFRRIREARGLAAELTTLRDDVAAFKTALEDAAFAGQAALEMLRAEATSLDVALEELQHGHGPSHRLTTQLLQHEAFTGLGRGSSNPISAQAPPPRSHYGVHFAGDEDEEDPDASPPAGAPSTANYLSPTCSVAQQRVAVAMRTLSSQTPAAALPRSGRAGRPNLRVTTSAPAGTPPAGTPPDSPTPAAPLGRAPSLASPMAALPTTPPRAAAAPPWPTPQRQATPPASS